VTTDRNPEPAAIWATLSLVERTQVLGKVGIQLLTATNLAQKTWHELPGTLQQRCADYFEET
jgi:hypothetical protein